MNVLLDEIGQKEGGKLSEEHKRNISEALTGRKLSEETKRKMSESRMGHIVTEKTRRRISKSFTGKKLSEEHKRAISGTNKRKGIRPPSRQGCVDSEETKRKRIEARKGYKHSVETIRKMSVTHTGKEISEEQRRKISATLQGISLDEWDGFKSFEPYCVLFNDELKEIIRNRDERRCQICGKSEILNGRRLAVHHIDGDKMQGCDGKKWYLVALCDSCHSKPDTVIKEFLLISNLQAYKGGR